MNIELLKEVKTPEETASIVYEILKAKGIEVVLTGVVVWKFILIQIIHLMI